jgi:hypothetical protein
MTKEQFDRRTKELSSDVRKVERRIAKGGMDRETARIVSEVLDGAKTRLQLHLANEHA